MTRQLRLTALVPAALLLMTLFVPVQAQGDDSALLRDIAYLPLASGDLLLDAFLPGRGEMSPVVLMLHGYHGSKGEVRGLVGDLTAQGWAVVVPNIRYSPDGFPYDAFCALAWVYAGADDYGFDPTHIAVYGTALGGQVAALIGAIDRPGMVIADACPYPAPPIPPVDAVVTWGGLFGTAESLSWSGLRARWAVLAEQSPRDYNALLDELIATPPLTWREPGVLSDAARAVAQGFPLYWINGTEPPHLLLFGTSNFDSSRRENDLFAHMLALGGVDATLVDMAPFSEQSGALAGQTDAIEHFLAEIFAPVVAQSGCDCGH